jgi:dethiobiotin synthetase
MSALIVTGTDTDIGKTVVSAMLTLALDAYYWKPIQAGIADGTDRGRVAALTGLSPSRLFASRYVLREALSPHRAAELDGVQIEPAQLGLPPVPQGRRLIVEGAGGVLVPITRALLQADLFAQWRAPAVLVARTALGTINHTLLSLEALRARDIPVLGVIFSGEAVPDTERTIAEFGQVKRLGRLPPLPQLNASALRTAFDEHFEARDFEPIHAG